MNLMHQSILITKKSKEDRIKKIEEIIGAKIDALSIDDILISRPSVDSSISINEIKSVIKELSFKPVKTEIRNIIILDADAMTTEASNALLKSLEEPPGYIRFVLEAPTLEDLLPTVVSRCIKIELGNHIKKNEYADLESEIRGLISASVGARIDYMLKNKHRFDTKDSTIQFLDAWENVCLELLRMSDISDKELIKTTKKIINTKRLLSKFNVNIFLLLESLIYNY